MDNTDEANHKRLRQITICGHAVEANTNCFTACTKNEGELGGMVLELRGFGNRHSDRCRRLLSSDRSSASGDELGSDNNNGGHHSHHSGSAGSSDDEQLGLLARRSGGCRRVSG